ncbi:hypothetical protein TNCV_4008361 [Trichonephila clavipes]|nr:hypothetical protein TNCV_4008361 [Trichonephila clavipes]
MIHVQKRQKEHAWPSCIRYRHKGSASGELVLRKRHESILITPLVFDYSPGSMSSRSLLLKTPCHRLLRDWTTTTL